jgi:hypothetical protein
VLARTTRTIRLALAFLLVACTPAAAHDSFRGKLGVFHADGYEQRDSTWRYSLRHDGQSSPLIPTRLEPVGSGDSVSVHGSEEDGQLVGTLRAAEPLAAPRLGARKTAVILFNFAGNKRQPWTPEQARQSVFTGPASASAFFSEESWGRLSLTGKLRADGDVFGWYTIPSSSADCLANVDNSWTTEANAAAAADGVDLSGYDHIMYAFPQSRSCGFVGAANTGGFRTWYNGDLSVGVVGHELGHNLGLRHAGSYDCGDVTLSESCSLYEYGDLFDVMGSSPRHNSGWNLERLGLLDASNVQTLTASGTYAVRDALAPTSEATTLRIARTRSASGAVLDWYYLEIRKSGGIFDGFSLTDFVVQGVSIRLVDDPSHPAVSRLLDTTPTSQLGFSDAALAPGQTFSDGQVSVTTVSAGGGYATVDVTLPPPPADAQAPTAPLNLRGVATNVGVKIAWDASTDDSGVADYVVYRDGVEVGTTGETWFDDLAVSPGAHAYTVYAEDASGNRSSSSQPFIVTVPDPGSPPDPGSGSGDPGSGSGDPGGGASDPGTSSGDPGSGSGGSGSAAGGSTGTSDEPAPARGSDPVPSSGPVTGVRNLLVDVQAPSLRLSQQRLRSSQILLRVRATDDRGVSRVELWIDGRRRRWSARAGISFRWRPTPGRHRIVAMAFDRSGNRGVCRLRLRP